MTSQKRYRHYHDNNTASRFREREVPPRFKRQKSSSSPKPSPAEIPVNQENENLSHSPSTSPPLGQTTSTFSSSNTTSSTPIMKQPFRIVNGQPPPPGMWQSQLPKDSLSVKTGGFVDYGYPVSELYCANNYVHSQNYLTPPLSPWGMENRQFNVIDGAQRAQMPSYSQTPRSSPDIVYHEGVAPALEMAKASPDGLWIGPSPNIVNPDRLATASPIQPDVLQKQSRVSDTKKRVDYSDPDIRTIEMLRELERVADQKEKEDEADLGVDRKNLVSHHLRMLMCAVDRYTADMGEDSDDSSSGKSTPPPKTDSKTATTKNGKNVQESSHWQHKQGKKQRSINNQQLLHCKSEQQIDIQAQIPQQIRDTPKNIGSVSNMPHPHQQWSNMHQATNSIYNTSWQMKQPPQSQSPSIMPPGTSVAPVQMMSAAAVSQKSLSTSNISMSTQAPPQRAVTSFNISQVNSKSCFPGTFPANFHAVQTKVPPPVPSSADNLTPQQALAHIWSPQYIESGKGLESKSWDIWSGPSFVNIYSHELCNSGTRNPTELERGFLDYVNTSTNNESKPLYMR